MKEFDIPDFSSLESELTFLFELSDKRAKAARKFEEHTRKSPRWKLAQERPSLNGPRHLVHKTASDPKPTGPKVKPRDLTFAGNGTKLTTAHLTDKERWMVSKMFNSKRSK